LLAVVALLGARVARAQVPNDPEKAKVLFQDAMRHYNIGEFGLAASKFIDAYKAMPDPTFLYNAAQAYRLGGQHQKALFFYKSYLRDAPNAPNREEVEKRIEQLKQIQEPPSDAQTPKGTGPVDPNVVPKGNGDTTPKGNGDTTPKGNGDTTPKGNGDTSKGKIDTTVPDSAVDTTPVLVDHGGGSKPIYKKWWFWTGVGVVAVGAVAVVVLTSGGGGNDTELGDIGPGATDSALGARF